MISFLTFSISDLYRNQKLLWRKELIFTSRMNILQKSFDNKVFKEEGIDICSKDKH